MPRDLLKTLPLVVVVAASVVVTAGDDEVTPHENLNATLWVQTSAEYRALALQAYGVASRRLDEALQGSPGDACLEAATVSAKADRPHAVIVDIDETVLDNSPFQARLIDAREPYTPERWKTWVEEEAARPVPGALAFLTHAARHGVTVFYLTNRTHDLEDATRRNLERWGFPLASDRDTVLTKGEREGWTSDKSSRRRFVCTSHRVLLLVGDDLGDFVPGARTFVDDRARLVDELQAEWGRRWLVIPNPTYGSWERALQGFARLDPSSALKLKHEALDRRRR